MPSFVVETFVPQGDTDRFAADVRDIRAALKAIQLARGSVRYLRSYLVPSDEMGFHVVEAAAEEEVEQITRLARVEVARIVAMIGFDSDARGRRSNI